MVQTIQSESGMLAVEGGMLYYEVAGEGHPLVLIHAGVAHHRMWDPQWEEFAREYRVIRYDTRGFGKSKTESEETSFSNRQDLYDLLTHLGVDRAHVVGVSRGGQIAIDFTLERPEMVSALVLVGSGLGGFDGTPSEAELRMFDEMERLWEAKDFEKLTELELQMWIDGPGQSPDRVGREMRKRVRDMILFNYNNQPVQGKPRVLDPPAAGRISEIKVPTLIIVGDLDESNVDRVANVLVEGIAGAKKVVMPGTAHLPNMEKPEEFNRIVLDFLRNVKRQDAETPRLRQE